MEENDHVPPLVRAKTFIESTLSTYQALQRFYRVDSNYKLIEQVQNYRGEAKALIQLANVKRLDAVGTSTIKEKRRIVEFAKADLKSAEEIYKRLEYPEGVSRVHETRGKLYIVLNELQAAKKEFELALDIAADANDKYMEANMREQLMAVEAEIKRQTPVSYLDVAGEEVQMKALYRKISKNTDVLDIDGIAEVAKTLGNNPLSDEEKAEIAIQFDIKRNTLITFEQFWVWWTQA